MEKGLRYYQKAMDILFKIILAYGAIIIALDVVSIFLEAFGRYLLGSSRAFMEEYPRLLIPFMVFPLMGVILRLKKHIAVEILPERLTGRKRSLMLVILYAFIMMVSIEFLIAGIISVKYYYQTGFQTQTEFAVPLWCVYLSFPVGFGILILFTLETLWQELISLLKKTDQNYAQTKGGGCS